MQRTPDPKIKHRTPESGAKTTRTLDSPNATPNSKGTSSYLTLGWGTSGRPGVKALLHEYAVSFALYLLA